MSRRRPEGGAAQSVNEDRPGRGQPVLALVAVALLAVALACALGAASQNWYATAVPGAGLTVRLCAGFTPPPVRVGIAWQSLLSSYASPLTMSRFAACIDLPHGWVAPNPQTHSWEWLWP